MLFKKIVKMGKILHFALFRGVVFGRAQPLKKFLEFFSLVQSYFYKWGQRFRGYHHQNSEVTLKVGNPTVGGDRITPPARFHTRNRRTKCALVLKVAKTCSQTKDV